MRIKIDSAKRSFIFYCRAFCKGLPSVLLSQAAFSFVGEQLERTKYDKKQKGICLKSIFLFPYFGSVDRRRSAAAKRLFAYFCGLGQKYGKQSIDCAQ